MLYRATNLPDLDSFKESGLSDPYVKIEVGSIVATSSVLEETLNPVRNYLHQGQTTRRTKENTKTIAAQRSIDTLRSVCSLFSLLHQCFVRRIVFMFNQNRHRVEL